MRNKNLLLQEIVLRKLLNQSKNTRFGTTYLFSEILKDAQMIDSFRSNVPTHDYADQKLWWDRCFEGESDVVCPGTISYFALSSGTSDNTSKFIPVSDLQLAQVRRQSIKFTYHLAKNRKIPISTFLKRNLLIGGSTDLYSNGKNRSGDLSGILQCNIPTWYKNFSAPIGDYTKLNWADKIDHIVSESKNWNVSIITGIPSWVQLVLEKIIGHYKLKHIHELWPNLNAYIHSGIQAEPYIQSINKLFGKKVFWYGSYLASEGFFAYQVSQRSKGMRLILDDSIFYEFVPFNEANFDPSGTLKKDAQFLSIHQIEPHIDYALLITTCSGAWRYLIGDTVRFTDVNRAEIMVSGRTSHFLNAAGEHLSLDNMNQAIEHLSKTLHFDCKEFTVFARKESNNWSHVWYIGCDEALDPEEAKVVLDEKLKALNDDYRTERMYAITNIRLYLLPNLIFYSFLEKRGKAGGQVKFPRVMKGELLDDWERHVLEYIVNPPNR